MQLSAQQLRESSPAAQRAPRAAPSVVTPFPAWTPAAISFAEIMSCEWTPVGGMFALSLASFLATALLRFFHVGCACKWFVSFYRKVLFHCVDVPRSVYPFTVWTFGFFLVFGSYKESLYKHLCLVFCEHSCHSLVGGGVAAPVGDGGVARVGGGGGLRRGTLAEESRTDAFAVGRADAALPLLNSLF